MSDDTLKVRRALEAVQRALAISHLPDPQRKWLEVFHLKLTRMRDNGTVLKPENRARLERLSVVVEDMLDRRRRELN